MILYYVNSTKWDDFIDVKEDINFKIMDIPDAEYEEDKVTVKGKKKDKVTVKFTIECAELAKFCVKEEAAEKALNAVQRVVKPYFPDDEISQIEGNICSPQLTLTNLN